MREDNIRRRAAKDKREIRKLLHKATKLPVSEAWIKRWCLNRFAVQLSGIAFRDKANITYFRTPAGDEMGRQYIVSVHVPEKDGEIDDQTLYDIKTSIENALDSFVGKGKWGSSRPRTYSGHRGSFGLTTMDISYWLPNLK